MGEEDIESSSEDQAGGPQAETQKGLDSGKATTYALRTKLRTVKEEVAP
jgi:hypothetical protein